LLLKAELINRLVVIEVQGILVRDKKHFLQSRSSAIRCLLEGLLGLIRTANTTESPNDVQDKLPLEPVIKQLDASRKARDESISRRTKVPPDIWQDTLSLLCDSESTVRNTCSDALIYYIIEEMPKHGENSDILKHAWRLADNSSRHIQIAHAFPRMTDTGSKFLNALYAYVYILATSPVLEIPSNALPTQPPDEPSSIASATVVEEDSGNPRTSNDNSSHSQSNTRRSLTSVHGPRARKESLVLRLLNKTPSRLTTSAQASEQDYANLLKIVTAVQVQLPIRGLLVGLPMILALDAVVKTLDCDPVAIQQIIAIRTIIAHVWLTIGQVWTVHAVIALAEKVRRNLAHFISNDRV
jgi:protein EFR3